MRDGLQCVGLRIARHFKARAQWLWVPPYLQAL